jgi:DNA-binding CsgD family transcriptional regulator
MLNGGYIPPTRYGCTMLPLPNLAETRLADLIRHSGTPEFENLLWSFLHTIVLPDNLVVLAFQDAGPPLVLYRRGDHPQVFAELDRIYLSGAFRLDPYFDLHIQRVLAGAYRLRDVAPDAFHRSRYFIEYYEQTTLIDEITFIANPARGVSLNICIGRDASSGKVFSPRAVETCQRLAPVIAALAEGHWAGIGRNNVEQAEDPAAMLARTARATRHIALSPRQAQVALLILRGHSTMSISLRLGVSVQTVKVFRKQLYARCNVSSQAELFSLMLPLLNSAA